ncbi:MAG: exodeoxyribonuclease VII large subunit [Gammaproteobacteria bacterium]|jgi:exodeoxyribonuclease VII large subunit
MSDDTQAASRPVFSVSQLNAAARQLLEDGFPLIWVEGEISNLSRPASGHLYFTLKDERAQIRCALFRNRRSGIQCEPQNGRQILVRGGISLYEARGDYQLIVEYLEEAGHGALQRAFEALRTKLQAEGLFDAALKRPLPAFPRRVGVITSPRGAALRDILSVLKRRFPLIEVLVYPVQVQGEQSAPQIVEALHSASRDPRCDVLILARGGGSLEDLWSFNDERVARALRDSAIPVVCGVGHETDFTIADFAADVRAPTPSAAAELISPSAEELAAVLRGQTRDLQTGIATLIGDHRQMLAELRRRLARQVGHILTRERERLGWLQTRLAGNLMQRSRERRQRLQWLSQRLQGLHPRRRMQQVTQRLDELEGRLRRAELRLIERRRERMTALARALNAISPLQTLERGYAIATVASDGSVIRSPDQVAPGDEIRVRVEAGIIPARVISTDDTD